MALLNGATTPFEGGEREVKASEAQVAEPYRQIGQLTADEGSLSKRLGR